MADRFHLVQNASAALDDLLKQRRRVILIPSSVDSAAAKPLSPSRQRRAARIGEFREFVARLQQDRTAVLAGLSLPWRQGQTKGLILRLKLIRRQMSGRGMFELVRERVLRAA